MKKTQHARVFTLCVSIYSIICNTFIRKENDTRKNIWWSECKHLQRLKWRNYNDQIYFVNIGTCGLHTFYSCMKNDKKFPQEINKLSESVYTVIDKLLSLQVDYEKLRLAIDTDYLYCLYQFSPQLWVVSEQFAKEL